jgi:hypothetical protein
VVVQRNYMVLDHGMPDLRGLTYIFLFFSYKTFNEQFLDKECPLLSRCGILHLFLGKYDSTV